VGHLAENYFIIKSAAASERSFFIVEDLAFWGLLFGTGVLRPGAAALDPVFEGGPCEVRAGCPNRVQPGRAAETGRNWTNK